jgi:alkaline phosphatase
MNYRLYKFLSLILVFVTISSCKPREEKIKEVAYPKPKNIIFFIGDGMGIAHVYAGMTRNHGKLYLEKCTHVGLQKTYSSNNYITDSAASGTALATGVKTKNGMLGMNADSIPVKTILEYSEENGFATGLVATCSITHATPASFISHQVNRNMYEEIAADFLKTDIDLFIGGGSDHFKRRRDSVDLTLDLKNKGYNVLYSLDDILKFENGKLAGLTAPGHIIPFSEGRGDFLPDVTEKAISILEKNSKGFFLMVEGSQIDWAGHGNNQEYIIEEVLDFDRAIGKALTFAENNGETLIVITADHETGGMALNGGSIEDCTVNAAFTTGGHSAEMVPVFAFGPGAEKFTGIYENTAIFEKFMELFGFAIE